MSEQQSDIAIGVIEDMAESYKLWMQRQGTEEQLAYTVMNQWHEFIRSEDGRKYRFGHK